MARILASQGKDIECDLLLRAIIREHPRFMPAYCELAELNMRRRRIHDAVQTLKAGLRVSPRDPILLNNLGICLMLKGDYGGALRALTRAAGIVPQNARYRANMAACLGLMRRYEEALGLYGQVMPLKDAYFNLGVLCEANRDSAQAVLSHGAALAGIETAKNVSEGGVR